MADMTTILAIDPGPFESAYALIDADTRRPLWFAKVGNDKLRSELGDFGATWIAIEMIASYGMPVGAEVFHTCFWIGRLAESVRRDTDIEAELVKRHPVKLHHCHSTAAKDSNITQALVDRFAPGQPNKGKGTKANPGWFYGFHADIWQAYALAVYIADTLEVERSA